MMGAVAAFIIIVVVITFLTARYRFSPFLTLLAAALLFGILTGMPEGMAVEGTAGAGRIFALLGIPVFCGAVIAQVIRHEGFLDRIVGDLASAVRIPPVVAGGAGFFLSIPLMCCITPFLVLAPLVAHMHPDRESASRLLYITAFGSIISFVLLFPLPVVYAIVTTTGLQAAVPGYVRAAVPLSLLLLAGGMLLLGRDMPAIPPRRQSAAAVPRWRAWLPVLFPVILITAGALIPPAAVIGNVHVALLAGAFAALAVAPSDFRGQALEKGTKHAGIIIFDLCGAGALGGVIAASGFAEEIFALLGAWVPLLLIPFLLAAMIQTAQGSRVVTGVVTATVLAGTPVASLLPPVPLVLLIVAGTLVVSYVSDPYFWLVMRTTGDSLRGTLVRFTLPQAAAGIVLVCAASLLYAVS
ncbi:MAG: GntP family permease [Methanomicrobiales archaeon]|nr:GntP family permease [Methanomicrobiales archaeon]